MSLHNEYTVDSERNGSTDSHRREGWIIPVVNAYFADVDPAAWPADYGPGEFVTPEDGEFLLYGLPRYKNWHEVMLRALTAIGETWTAEVEYWLLDSLPAADPALVLADYLAHGRRLREGTISDDGTGEDLDHSPFDTHRRYLLIRLVNETGLFVEGEGEAEDVWYPLTARVLSWNAGENERFRAEQDLNVGHEE